MTEPTSHADSNTSRRRSRYADLRPFIWLFLVFLVNSVGYGVVRATDRWAVASTVVVAMAAFAAVVGRRILRQEEPNGLSKGSRLSLVAFVGGVVAVGVIAIARQDDPSPPDGHSSASFSDAPHCLDEARALAKVKPRVEVLDGDGEAITGQLRPGSSYVLTYDLPEITPVTNESSCWLQVALAAPSGTLEVAGSPVFTRFPSPEAPEERHASFAIKPVRGGEHAVVLRLGVGGAHGPTDAVSTHTVKLKVRQPAVIGIVERVAQLVANPFVTFIGAGGFLGAIGFLVKRLAKLRRRKAEPLLNGDAQLITTTNVVRTVRGLTRQAALRGRPTVVWCIGGTSKGQAAVRRVGLAAGAYTNSALRDMAGYHREARRIVRRPRTADLVVACLDGAVPNADLVAKIRREFGTRVTLVLEPAGGNRADRRGASAHAGVSSPD